MRISNQCICAVEAMADMLVEGRDRPRTTHAIAQRVGRSVSYIEQIMAKLRDAGLIKGERGPGGGYTLRHPAHRIAIADIVRAVEAAPAAGRAESRDASGPVRPDGPDQLWEEVANCTMSFLSGVSLAEAVPTPRFTRVKSAGLPSRPSFQSVS